MLVMRSCWGSVLATCPYKAALICDSTSIGVRPTRACLDAVGADHQVRVFQFDVGFDVLGAGLHYEGADLHGQFAEFGQIGSEDLDLDRLGRPGKVVDLVFDEGFEFDVVLKFRDRFRHAIAEILADLGPRPLALVRRLEAYEDVAGVRLGGEVAQFRSGAADVAGHLGRIQEQRLDPAQHRVGLLEGSPRGHLVVEDEGPLVHLGHEAAVDVLVEPPGRRDGQQGQDDHQPRRPQAGSQQTFVTARQDVVDRPAVRHPFPPEEAGGEHGDKRQADDHRDQQGHRERQAQRLEELADHPVDEGQRNEDQDRGQGRADHRPADLAAGRGDGRVALLPFGHVAGDVLHDHHRVVDHQPDRHRQAAQRHQVQRVVGQLEEEEADRQAQRDGNGRQERGPHALEEQQENQHAEEAADEDRVADVVDGRPH